MGKNCFSRRCACDYQNKCKSCVYADPSKVPPLYYDYWNETWWMNWNTTNGWGPTKGETNQGLDTADNLNGYGVNGGNGYGNTLPQGKKLMRVFEYNGKIYTNPSALVFVNNKYIEVSNIPGVKKYFRILPV